MSQCLQIQEKLRGFKKNLVEPHRKFINQFAFNLKKDKKLKPQQLCVFSDAVIVTNLKWKVKAFLKMDNIHIKIINNEEFGKGFILKYAMEDFVYFDTQETMHDDVKELNQIIIDAQEMMLQKKTSRSYTKTSELERIQIEHDEEKKSLMMKMKSKDNMSPSSPARRRATLQMPEQNQWGRSLKMDKDTNVMTVQWKFIDENGDAHIVILKHEQNKANPKQKTKRKILINEVEKFASNKSKKDKWKFELYDWKKIKNTNKKQVTLTIAIKHDPKKNKYTYPLSINGISYPKAFSEWRQMHK